MLSHKFPQFFRFARATYVRLCHSTTQHSNVDPREIDNLGKLSEEWWDPTGPLKGLHSMNAIRVPLIRDGLISTGLVQKDQINTASVLKGLNILEVGCGGGLLTEALAQIRADVVGIDPGEKLVQVAESHARMNERIAGQITYSVETIEEHAKNNAEKYDAVVASEVLEHVNDKVSFLEHCIMALKPGGSIFITTLNKTTASWLGGIIAAEYVLKLVPENTHDWDKFIPPLDCQRILKTFNCNTILVHGMAYEFWQNNWSWCKWTDINYAIQAVKLTENT
ncbi:ubiquinone biosynthesis O-methyltransferase, mitochondrial [Toxorhynchites rutilus septentrionalis]|uniref:ubiquinone biosynthesis O-methyltransferase, mitochondrial n=1 Tax=Toxorhynchites rutilus septentrionalis TaxID=329112 RepID=UPI002479AF02|nr:ubiquinone biosynthesis O-methyltransferase, mitochondrial [Toxorhynchites rutilus septentrionalis]XP_055628167.1 ubiquinone biosynthesis O-methyltransferase, mitochondrial [Toxorhynchites rutilus septentrionalis]XP_055628169.1 ubiquinone biosynthesis O-methyltransferase, mitochondrial [Toxorhynchites rutilus septentrionalis]